MSDQSQCPGDQTLATSFTLCIKSLWTGRVPWVKLGGRSMSCTCDTISFFLSPLLHPTTLSHKLTQVWELSTMEFKSRLRRPRPLLLIYIFMSVYKSNRPQWTAIWFSFQEPHDQLTTEKTSDEQTDPSAFCVHSSSSSDSCVWLPASDLQGHFPLPLWLAVLQINQCAFSDRGHPFAFWAQATVNQQEKD